MSQVTEHVNIENLLVQAMHQGTLPLPEDPLPSAEEIAGAKAAAATAHSTCSAAVTASHPVKGLGGAGLGLKRKNGSKAGNSSTISAATAPPAVFGTSKGGRGAIRGGPVREVVGASSSNLGSRPAAEDASSSSSSTAEKGPASTASLPGAAHKADSSSSAAAPPEGARGLRKDAAGVQSFRPVLSPETEHDSSSDWESASQEEAAASTHPVAAKLVAKPPSSCISSVLEDWVDSTTLVVCGIVLGTCAGALLVLGAKVWMWPRLTS